MYDYIKSRASWVNNNQPDLSKKVALNYFGNRFSYNEVFYNIDQLLIYLRDIFL